MSSLESSRPQPTAEPRPGEPRPDEPGSPETAGGLCWEPGAASLAAEVGQAFLAPAGAALAKLARDLEGGSPQALALAREADDLPALRQAAGNLAAGIDDLLVLGTGGSASGARALATIAGARSNEAPRLHYPDSLDPVVWERLLAGLDLERSGLLIVSKSGSTAETLAQSLALLPLLRGAGRLLGGRVLAISDPGDNPLRRLAAREGFAVLDHPAAVGGRFSVFSPVGLLPAILEGLDPAALRQGAREVLDAACGAADPARVPAVQGAALAAGLAAERGIRQTVLWPYSDRLFAFGIWYRQLWAESLGKAGQGSTPILGLGAADQHSQLQLYLEGPNDKLYTLLTLDSAGAGPLCHEQALADPATAFLAQRSLGDLLMAEARATAETLANHGRPLRVLRLETLDERRLGGLFMHFFLETLLTAALWQIDPFGQPAVDEGKRLARQYLSEDRR